MVSTPTAEESEAIHATKAGLDARGALSPTSSWFTELAKPLLMECGKLWDRECVAAGHRCGNGTCING